jgi:predicted enzyme related to lactoylglutathione lyase
MPQYNVVHIEIPAINAKTSGEFYRTVFGWQIEADPTYGYVQFRPEVGPGGGFPETSGPGPFAYRTDSVLIYVGTDDIEGALASIEAAGGKTLMTKTEIPGIGWWAVFLDPSGNRLALFTPAPPASQEEALAGE